MNEMNEMNQMNEMIDGLNDEMKVPKKLTESEKEAALKKLNGWTKVDTSHSFVSFVHLIIAIQFRCRTVMPSKRTSLSK